MPNISRRTLIGTGAAALTSTALGVPKNLPASVKRKPKNIIFCVADGMAQQTLSMADIFQDQMMGHRSYWHWLANQDYVTNGLQMTRSLGSVVTDSAAASSAWGSGRHIWNGQLNTYPDGTKLRTLQSILKEHGMKTGLVTTTTITHATPAG
ncbi:MAG: alkaline phosphatase, partial [Armatimonadota bacterium]